MEENMSESITKEPETQSEPVIRSTKAFFRTMKVFNCDLLNVRKLASPDAEVLTQLPKGSLVNVNLDKSTEEYYYVASEITDQEHKIPIHGFCKKSFLIE